MAKKWPLSIKLLMGFGCLVFAGFVYLQVSVAPRYKKEVIPKARQSEAKSTLVQIYTEMRIHEIDHREFSLHVVTKVQNREPASSESRRYRVIADVSNDPFAKYHCPDCGVTRHKFKIMAYGNIDEDDTQDIWTIDEGKNLVHVVNDAKL